MARAREFSPSRSKGRDPGVVRKPAFALLDMLVEQLLTVATGWGPL
jgi:hypothetical protein